MVTRAKQPRHARVTARRLRAAWLLALASAVSCGAPPHPVARVGLGAAPSAAPSGAPRQGEAAAPLPSAPTHAPVTPPPLAELLAPAGPRLVSVDLPGETTDLVLVAPLADLSDAPAALDWAAAMVADAAADRAAPLGRALASPAKVGVAVTPAGVVIRVTVRASDAESTAAAVWRAWGEGLGTVGGAERTRRTRRATLALERAEATWVARWGAVGARGDGSSLPGVDDLLAVRASQLVSAVRHSMGSEGAALWLVGPAATELAAHIAASSSERPPSRGGPPPAPACAAPDERAAATGDAEASAPGADWEPPRAALVVTVIGADAPPEGAADDAPDRGDAAPDEPSGAAVRWWVPLEAPALSTRGELGSSLARALGGRLELGPSAPPTDAPCEAPWVTLATDAQGRPALEVQCVVEGAAAAAALERQRAAVATWLARPPEEEPSPAAWLDGWAAAAWHDRDALLWLLALTDGGRGGSWPTRQSGSSDAAGASAGDEPRGPDAPATPAPAGHRSLACATVVADLADAALAGFTSVRRVSR